MIHGVEERHPTPLSARCRAHVPLSQKGEARENATLGTNPREELTPGEDSRDSRGQHGISPGHPLKLDPRAHPYAGDPQHILPQGQTEDLRQQNNPALAALHNHHTRLRRRTYEIT